MKKIVHIIIGLDIGGAELMLKRLVSYSQHQHQHIVISLTTLGVIGPTLQQDGIEVYSLNMKSLFTIPRTEQKLITLLNHLHPDVVQTWMYHADFLGGLAAKVAGIDSIIWGVRTTDVTKGASKMTVQLSRICAKLSYLIPKTIVCAAHVSKDYHIAIGYDASKMKVIPNGYNIKALRAPKQARRQVRHEMGVSQNDLIVGSVGRFNPVKNQLLFIQAAALLLKDMPNITFMLVGRGNSDDNDQLMAWIAQYQLGNNIKLLGQRNDVPSCLKAMDVFCLHSNTEGFPNVLVEAMAAGVPCVATDVGDAKQILDRFGIIVPAEDAKALADGMKTLINQRLSDNAANAAKIEQESLSYIEQKFDIATIYKQFSQLWDN